MKRSKFSLGYTKLLSANMGTLTPIGLTEVLPGDSIQHATSCLIRTMPLLAPVMHPVRVQIHHWFVPHRLVWDDFEKFITGGPDGLDATVAPTITMPAEGGAAIGSLADYLGVPPGVNSLAVSALPFRGYALIFNEWYRDQDLVTALALSRGNGADSTTSTALKNAAWEKDYFTSARPWEAKGPTITVPLGDSAPVVLDNPSVPGTMIIRNAATGVLGSGALQGDGVTGILENSGSTNLTLDPNGRLITDLSDASAVTINVLREALALQRYQEARARYGSRYTEYLAYLGVRSSDARLQRPEYLGGGTQTLQFSEVLQTAEGEDPVGEMRGHGISALRTNRYRRFFEEHGYVFTLLVVRPKTIYVQGLARHWSRATKEDYYQKELQTIGQQAVHYKELYAGHATPNGIFGFQDRYDEYRRNESSVAGEFRDTTLNFWHLARTFSSDPALNSDFVTCTPTERVFPVDTQDVLYVMAKHQMMARRLLAQTGKSMTF